MKLILARRFYQADVAGLLAAILAAMQAQHLLCQEMEHPPVPQYTWLVFMTGVRTLLVSLRTARNAETGHGHLILTHLAAPSVVRRVEQYRRIQGVHRYGVREVPRCGAGFMCRTWEAVIGRLRPKRVCERLAQHRVYVERGRFGRLNRLSSPLIHC